MPPRSAAWTCRHAAVVHAALMHGGPPSDDIDRSVDAVLRGFDLDPGA